MKRPLFELPKMAVNEALNEAMDKLIEDFKIKMEKLNREQMADAIKQAIACGDFQKYIMVPDGASCVVYIPFQREQELLDKIKKLEAELTEIRNQDIPGEDN